MMTSPKPLRSLTLVAVLLAYRTAFAAPPPPPPGARVLTLDECIAAALASNVDAQSSELEIHAANEARKGVRNEYLPRVRADGNVEQWDSAFTLPFALPGASGPVPVLTVRDAFTWTGSVSLIQPITGI